MVEEQWLKSSCRRRPNPAKPKSPERELAMECSFFRTDADVAAQMQNAASDFTSNDSGERTTKRGERASFVVHASTRRR